MAPWTAPARTLVYVPPGCADPRADASDGALLRCFAPALQAPDAERSWNRIGTPVISRGALGGLHVAVDPDRPALFGEVRTELVADRVVLQLVYRVHFQKIPLRATQLFYEAHDNAGLLAVVTLDAATLVPLFVTTVHTCGCYRAVQPTRAFPDARLPPDWPAELSVYGQRLPARLDPPGPQERLLLRLQADDHRIRDSRFAAALPEGERVELPLLPMDALRHAPVSGSAEGERASVFYTAGPLRGHLRSAWNPLEGLTVFGWVALDPTVGMDKDFGDPRATGTPFYTEIAFYHQDASRLDRFDRMLRAMGFRAGSPSDPN